MTTNSDLMNQTWAPAIKRALGNVYHIMLPRTAKAHCDHRIRLVASDAVRGEPNDGAVCGRCRRIAQRGRS